MRRWTLVKKPFAPKKDSSKEAICTKNNISVLSCIMDLKDTKFQQNPKRGKSSTQHVGRKSRRKYSSLTEDEKAERRQKRMLANRESARQTIVRRQARCEELVRRAAELERDNERLKKVKEVAMKDCESLKSTNESLKAQLNLSGVTLNVEVEETQEGAKFDNAHIPTSTSTKTQPISVYNQSSSSPYINPASNIVQSAPQNGIACTSKTPVLTKGKASCLSGHENPVRMNVPVSPFALPYPWFFPLPYYANGVPPWSSALANKDNITNESSASSFRKPVADVKNDRRYPLKVIRGEASTATATNRPSAHKQNVTSAAVTDSSSEANEKTVIGINARQNDAITRRNEIITPAVTISTSSEETEDQTDGILPRRQMNAFMAREARKRRKGIITRKNLHYYRKSHGKR